MELHLTEPKGNTSWKEAMNLDGSKHISLCMKYSPRLNGGNSSIIMNGLKPHVHEACDGHFAAGIPKSPSDIQTSLEEASLEI